MIFWTDELFISECSTISILYQARQKVLAIGAANSEKGGGSERGLILISSLALIRSPGKNTLQISGGTFWGYCEM